MSSKPILYTCANSRGLRASWTAAELGIELDYRMLPYPPRVRATEYLQINPLGTVPALVHDGHVLTESSAISYYLATQAGPTSLVVQPGEPEYAAFLDFVHYGETTITVPQSIYVKFSLVEKHLGLQAAGEVYAQLYAQHLGKAANRLDGREFLCAGRFTVADVGVTYALHLSTLIGLDHLVPDALKAYRARMTARPAFVQALAREREAAAQQGVVTSSR